MDPIFIEKGVYRCPAKGCMKESSRKHNIQMHLRRHTREKPFKCGFVGCTMAFGWRSSLNVHEKLHVQDGDVRRESQPKVEAADKATAPPAPSSTTTGNMSEVSHLTVEETDKEKPSGQVEAEDFYCEVVIMDEIVPANCLHCPSPDCGKLFNQSRDLAIHMRTHNLSEANSHLQTV